MAESDPQPSYLAGAPGTKLTHLSAAGTTLLKTGAGMIVSISINNPAASGSLLTVYDGTSAAGTVMAIADCTKQTANVGFAGWPFVTGCFLNLTGAPDITIVWR
jgi:hypothetical protein